MRRTPFLLLTLLVLASAKGVLAQDPVKLSPNLYKVVLENDQVRVLEYRVKPGDKEPLHSHPFAVVYSFTDGRATAALPDGKSQIIESKAGGTVWSPPVTHAWEYVGPGNGRALIVELKKPAAIPSRAEVQKLMDDRDDARHKGAWNAYGQFFTPDATVINSDGKSFRGRAEIQKSVQDMWGAGVYKGSRMKTLVGSVGAIAANVAIVDANYEITNIPGGGSRKGLSTFVLLKVNDAWRVAAARSIVPTAAGSIR